MASTHLLVCDDIRLEAGNKKSFMGVYGTQIVCPSLPFQFPKLCFIVSIEIPRSKLIKSLEFEITVPGIPPAKFSIPPAQLTTLVSASSGADDTRFRYKAEMIATPLPLPEEGVIQVTARINGRKQRVGTILVKLQEAAPTTAPPRKTKRRSKTRAPIKRPKPVSPKKS